MRRVFVTGVGVISSLGFGREAFWRSLVSGRSGAAPIELFDTSDLDRSIRCLPGFDYPILVKKNFSFG